MAFPPLFFLCWLTSPGFPAPAEEPQFLRQRLVQEVQHGVKGPILQTESSGNCLEGAGAIISLIPLLDGVAPVKLWDAPPAKHHLSASG